MITSCRCGLSPRRFFSLTDACCAAGIAHASLEEAKEGTTRIRLPESTPEVSSRQLEVLRRECPAIAEITAQPPLLLVSFTASESC